MFCVDHKKKFLFRFFYVSYKMFPMNQKSNVENVNNTALREILKRFFLFLKNKRFSWKVEAVNWFLSFN